MRRDPIRDDAPTRAPGNLVGCALAFLGAEAEVIESVGVTVEFSVNTSQPLRPPPRLGEHGAEVLESLGYSAQDSYAGIAGGWFLGRRRT